MGGDRENCIEVLAADKYFVLNQCIFVCFLWPMVLIALGKTPQYR